MGKDSVPSVRSLEKPEDLNKLLKEDYGDDCLSCRILGGGAFLGLAGYNYLTGMRQLEARRAEVLKSKSPFGMKTRRGAILGLSLSLASLGVYRLVR